MLRSKSETGTDRQALHRFKWHCDILCFREITQKPGFPQKSNCIFYTSRLHRHVSLPSFLPSFHANVLRGFRGAIESSEQSTPFLSRNREGSKLKKMANGSKGLLFFIRSRSLLKRWKCRIGPPGELAARGLCAQILQESKAKATEVITINITLF